ncbi:MAG: SPOR domain-containing protein [Vulcanimicrobiota bacterium]
MFKMIDGPKLPPYARYTIATVFVIWFALAGGSWLGRAIVASELLGKEDDQVEFRSMPEPRARPWVKVDPELEKELEALRTAAGPTLTEKLVGEKKSDKEAEPTVLATPSVGAAVVGEGRYLLQFGAFSNPENATRLKEQLNAQGQEAKVEKVESQNGVLYRVKGPSFHTAEEAERLARNLRTQSFQVFVVGE